MTSEWTLRRHEHTEKLGTSCVISTYPTSSTGSTHMYVLAAPPQLNVPTLPASLLAAGSRRTLPPRPNPHPPCEEER